MNIIETMQNALETFPDIEALHIDYNGNTSNDFGLYPTGDRLISEDVLGNMRRRHTFILYSIFQSFNDYDRLQNSGALLSLQYYLERYPSRQTVTANINGNEHTGELLKITCSNGMLFSVPDGNMNTAVRYQLQITAEYSIEI